MAEGLRERYTKAGGAYQQHADRCLACQDDQRCTVGSSLFAEFTRLQDAYLKRVRDAQNQN
ncbi:hypothetical protein ACIOJD_33800 [Streptomyces sp. NPDC088116]|uniref:hypothetical protein n=1 Tax=Streptomyces sp. NPDC088116 TaxID=3365825 RepID=UPI003818B2D3